MSGGTPHASGGQRVLRRILGLLQSVKLTVVVLLLLATGSVAGTAVPQKAEPRAYEERYGVGPARALSALGLTNVFESWWFLALAGWLTASMATCALTRLPGLLADARSRALLEGPDEFRRQPHWRAASIRGATPPSAALEGAVSRVMRLHGYRAVARSEARGSLHMLVRKGPWGLAGPPLVHLSVLFVVAGGLLTTFWGTAQPVRAVVGEEADLPGSAYSVRLNDFRIDYYPHTVTPSEYTSDLEVLEGSRVVARGACKVNDPLRAAGFTFFQTRYGPVARFAAVDVLDGPEGVTVAELSLPMGQAVRVDALSLTVEVESFLPDFALTSDGVAVSRSPNLQNPAVLLGIYPDGEPRREEWLFEDMPDFRHAHDGAAGPIFVLRDLQTTFFSELKAVRDPGAGVVYVGFAIAVTGTFLCCYVAHRRVWIMLRVVNGGMEVWLAGRCGRDLSSFPDELSGSLPELLAVVEGARP